MTTTTAMQTIAVLKNIFATHGLPVSMVTDNGPQFTSDEFETYMKFCGIKHVKSPPYHPATNGEAERVVRTFKNSIRKTLLHTKDLHSCVANFLLGYRTSKHSTTNCSPAELLMGRTLKTRLDHLFMSNNDSINQQKCDNVKKPRQFTIGQKVFVRDYRRDKPKWTDGTIVRDLGPVSYRVQTSDGPIWKRHVDQMRKGTMNSCTNLGNSEPDLLEPIPVSTEQSTVSVDETNIRNEESTTDEIPTESVVNVPSVDSTHSRYPLRQRHRPQRLIEEC